MMSCFVFSRKVFAMFLTTLLLSGSLMMVSSQVSYADASWADLLKPLVKDVIVPGASMGMKKLTQRMEKKKGGSTSSDSSAAATGDDGSWTNAFASPQEPVSSSSSMDGVQGTPEEPMNTTYTSSAVDAPPPPPPPVATP